MRKRLVTGLLAAALSVNLLAATALAEPAPADAAGAAAVTEPTTTQVSSDFELMASNDQAELYASEELGAVAVKDLRSGFIWYSNVPSDTYDRTGLQAAQSHQLDSLVVLTYTELNNNDASTTTTPINDMEPEISTEKIDNGVRINYRVDDINLEMSVEAVLDGGALVLSVPNDRILEGEGTVDRMNNYIENIEEFINYANEALDEVESYDVRGTGSDIRKSRSRLKELQGIVDDLTSVVGVAAAQSQAKIILEDELKTFMCGGTSTVGIYGRVQNADVPSSVKSTWSGMQMEIENCSYDFGLLASIKYGGIVSLELAPNLGAASDTEEGYVFYPDGSGALTYNTASHGSMAEVYEASLYSDQDVDMSWENNRDSTGLKRAMLPVFGVKKNSHAYVAIVEDGDTNASLRFVPSGNNVNLNRVSASFVYRNEVQVTSSSQYATGVATIYNKERMETQPKVRYVFLDGENADYSGMANTYRDYLLEKGQLEKSDLVTDELPLAIDIYGYTYKSMLFFKQVMPLSTFEEMNQIINELNDAGITNTFLHIQQWDRNEDPNGFKVPGKLGGADGLRQLVENTRNIGGHVFLQTDMVDADTDEHSISNSRLAYDNNLKIYEYQTMWLKLFSPVYVQSQMASYLKDVDSLGNPGVGQYRMGSMIYNDYNTRNAATRDDTAQIWNDIYRTTQEQTETTSYSGNAYLLNGTDWLQDIPMSSTGYIFSDESIPFYQMVVHGLIPYSAKPFNHFYDADREKLQTIEYGAIPLYKITYRDSTDLRELFYGFTTPYSSVKDGMIEVYNEMNSRLSHLYTQYIVDHQRVTDDVVVETFSGGQKLYINYSEEDYTLDGVTIPALDYVVQ